MDGHAVGDGRGATEGMDIAATHRRVARGHLDGGLLVAAVGLAGLVVAPGPTWTLAAFVGCCLLCFGGGLYVPAHFVGREFFSAGGRFAVAFAYLMGYGVTFGALSSLLLAPVPVQRFVALVGLVSMAGLRVELEGTPFGRR